MRWLKDIGDGHPLAVLQTLQTGILVNQIILAMSKTALSFMGAGETSGTTTLAVLILHRYAKKGSLFTVCTYRQAFSTETSL